MTDFGEGSPLNLGKLLEEKGYRPAGERELVSDPRTVEELKFVAERVGQPQRVFYPGCGTDRSPADAFGADRVLFMDIDQETVSALQKAGLDAVCQDATTAEGKFDMMLLFNPNIDAKKLIGRVGRGGVIVANNSHGSAQQVMESGEFRFVMRVARDPETGVMVADEIWEPDLLAKNVNNLWVFQRAEELSV